MTHSPTSDRPTTTIDSDRLSEYLSYRVSVAHNDVDKVKEIITRYTDEYLIWPHRGDRDVPNEHFHVIIPTEDKKLSDRLCKAFRLHYGRNGNGFHSSKYHNNGVTDAIAYLKHDGAGSPIYAGAYWAQLIADTPAKDSKRGFTRGSGAPRERLGDPVLSYSNLIKQCLRHRDGENNLGNVLIKLKKMGWIPSITLIKGGIPEEYYDLWDQKIGIKDINTLDDWMKPHQRSEYVKHTQDVVFMSRYNN